MKQKAAKAPKGNRLQGEPLKKARKILDDAGVQVSFRENGSQIRVSPALFNNAAEIRRFLEVAERLSG